MNLELTPTVLLSKLHSSLLKTTPASKLPVIKILVAYSGGLDSHVLLHLLSQLSNDEISLRAIYINHGLQSQAVDWAIHCDKICQSLNISFTSVDLNLAIATGESIEEVARNGRYKAFSDNLEKGEVLLTAHHQNDQAETLLLQLFRGAGVQGLAAMPEITAFKSKTENAKHLRPLLGYSRSSLEAYAKEHALKYIEDPTNTDTAFDRNYLRQDIMPLLRERWLGIDKTISRAASIQSETKRLLDEFASQLLPEILSDEVHYPLKEENELTLAPIDIQKLSLHSVSKQRLLLRYWISQQGFKSPSDKKLEHVFDNLINAAEDKQPVIEWRGVELRRFQRHLYIMSPLSDHNPSQVFTLSHENSLNIESLSLIIDIDDLESDLVMHDFNQNQNLIIKFRQGGEKMEIPNRGNISLKNLFQEMQIPPWIRSRLPLLYQDEKLIKIIGLDDYCKNMIK